MALKKIFFGFSYRVPSSLNGKYISVFVFAKSALKLLWTHRVNAQKIGNDEVFIYDCKHSVYSGRVDYFNAIFKDPPQKAIFRDSLPNYLNLFEIIFITILIAFNSLVSLFVIKFFRNSSLCVLNIEFVENTMVLKFITKHQVKKLLILSSYEKDIFLLCYTLRKIGVQSEIFPSANPLKLAYKYVYADKIWFSAPFQLNEAKVLLENWNVKNYGQIPLYDFQYIKKIQKGTSYPFKIGIISSGMGFRKKQDILLGDEKELLAEIKLHEVINGLIKSGKINKNELIIFLHPKEKNKKDVDMVHDYYKNIFDFTVNFGPVDVATRKCFDLCEVAVATISTAQIERLFGGYKSIFAPLSVLENPFSDDRINRISANSESELILLIENSLNKTEEEFFNDFKLMDYHFNKFKNIPIHSNESIEI